MSETVSVGTLFPLFDGSRQIGSFKYKTRIMPAAEQY